MSNQTLMPGLQAHIEALSERLQINKPVQAYIAGGVAVNYHTGHRMSRDVDIKWSHRIPIPPDMSFFEVADPDDPFDVHVIGFDGSFNDTLGSFPPDWEQRCIEVARAGDIILSIMDPTDLAVSKVSRFEDRDKEDIRELASAGLVDLEAFKERAEEALSYFVGNTTFIEHNLKDAIELIETALKDDNDDFQPK